MVICLHGEHAVSIADSYGKVTQEPAAVALHSDVGLMHATLPIFNAWWDRTPMIILVPPDRRSGDGTKSEPHPGATTRVPHGAPRLSTSPSS